MEYTFYTYKKQECNLSINKMAIWFRETEFEGDEHNGSLTFHSQKNYDEIWGPDSTFEVSWEKKDRVNLLYYKEVERCIETYNAIGFVVTKKERDWLMSHEFTIWFGHRRKMIRKRYYVERVIHGIFFCEISERLINIHAAVIENMYDNFKPSLLKTFNTIECH